jgi:tricorn protease
LARRLLYALTFLVFACLTQTGFSSAPLNLRYPAPSPDGAKVCFSYKGDLWVVASDGGKAEPLTVHVGYDAYPKWSPDGKFIAFSGQRFGNYDIFLIPSSGGPEIRLTYHSADDLVSGWSGDSRRILFTSQRDHAYQQVWEVAAAGGRARPLTAVEGSDGRRSADANKLLFTHGSVPWWRKGYRGSAACDLFVKDLTTGSIDRVSSSTSNELNGYLTPGGGEMIYLSDSTGVYNLFKRNLVSGVVSQLTNHRLNATNLTLSQDASLAAYELGGEIFLYDFKTGQGRKLSVEISSPTKTNMTELLTFDSGLTEFALSPDGSLIAYVVRGEVFCRDLSGVYQQQLTTSAAEERDLSWSHDSKQLTFVSDRDLSYDVYLARSTDPAQTSLARSHDRDVGPFAKSDVSKRSPSISPDQSKLAYIRGETELVVTDIRKLTERTFAMKNPLGGFGWSPDGRYVVFTLFDQDWYNQLYIGDTESGTIYKISGSSGSYQNPRFSADGLLIYYINDNDIYYLYLARRLSEMNFPQRQETTAGTATKNSLGLPTVMIDFDEVTERAVRLTHQGNVEAATMTPNCATLVYVTANGQIERINLDGSDHKLVTTGISAPSTPQLSAEGDIVYVKDAAGKLYSVDLDLGVPSPLPFNVDVDVDYKQELQHMFDQAWQLLKERYYNPTMNGTDWNAVRQTYLPRVAAVTEVNDMSDLILELSGELNCSHISIWPADSRRGETGLIGIIPDYEDNSAGLRVKYIFAGSPATRLHSKLRLDDKITAVEGWKLAANADYYQAFENSVGKEIKLDIFSRDGISRSVLITPISADEYYECVYRDRVETNREMVAKLSQKKLAYLYLKEMDHDGLEDFENELAQQLDDKKGLILDIRGNVGGAGHDKMLETLARRSYITHRPRYGTAGKDSPGAVEVPIVLLIDEGTSSDAEIFAYGFRELGLGRIVGTNTYGAVLGTEHHRLVDGSVLTLPSVGWYTLKGEELENKGVAPDVMIPCDLTRLEKGEDNQLEEAVGLMMKDIK